MTNIQGVIAFGLQHNLLQNITNIFLSSTSFAATASVSPWQHQHPLPCRPVCHRKPYQRTRATSRPPTRARPSCPHGRTPSSISVPRTLTRPAGRPSPPSTASALRIYPPVVCCSFFTHQSPQRITSPSRLSGFVVTVCTFDAPSSTSSTSRVCSSRLKFHTRMCTLLCSHRRENPCIFASRCSTRYRMTIYAALCATNSQTPTVWRVIRVH